MYIRRHILKKTENELPTLIFISPSSLFFATPLYHLFFLFCCSLDARNVPLEKASHLAAAYDVGSRSYFITDHPSRARLKIKNVTPEDEGIFRCRVDFLNSPTRNFQINLTLVGQTFIFYL